MAGDTQSIHILVVEDNPGDLFLFQEFLHGTDLPVAEVRHAASLTEAKQLLAIHSTDLLFLDLSLILQTAWTLAIRLLNLPETRRPTKSDVRGTVRLPMKEVLHVDSSQSSAD